MNRWGTGRDEDKVIEWRKMEGWKKGRMERRARADERGSGKRMEGRRMRNRWVDRTLEGGARNRETNGGKS